MSEKGQQSLRIDKWLWAARFFKTRALAAEAVSGGKVHINGQRVKPSRPVKVGDQLEIMRGQEQFIVDVTAILARRGPAKLAQTLYQETDASQEKRAEQVQQRKILAQMHPQSAHKPSKRDRRKIIRFTRKQSSS